MDWYQSLAFFKDEFATIFPDCLTSPTPQNSGVRLEGLNQLEVGDEGECIFMKSEEGMYSFVSPGGPKVCGLYLIGDPDRQVVLEFKEVDISCAKGGLLTVFDGWELNGQYFPGPQDYPKPLADRYQEYCGPHKPRKPFVTSQNVALLMFRVPLRGEGLSLNVRYIYNPKPCNVVLQDPSAVYTLRNYGRRSNCSVSTMFPERLRVLATSVGTQSRFQTALDVETGIMKKCKKRGMRDYVEIRGGSGLDPARMALAEDFCGTDSIPGKNALEVSCSNTAIRLVSSGDYENSVTFGMELLLEPTFLSLRCPDFHGLF